MYLTWKTGCGKSSLIEQRVYRNRYRTRKNNDCNIIIIDPHWDTAEKIRRFDLAKSYSERLIFVDPFFSKGMTPCLNPMQIEDRSDYWIELYSEQLVKVFEDIIPDVLSTYMRALIKPCISTLLHVGSTDLVHLQQFMSPSHCEKRLEIGKKCKIESHRRFFKEEFENPIYARTKGSIYTKIQSLLNSTVFFNMTTWESTIRLEQLLRKWSIVVFKLSKGIIWDEVSITLWKLLIAQIKRIAMSNAWLPEWLRKPTYLVIDEADTYVSWSGNLISILKETRKYGLHLCMISQNLIGWRANSELQRNLLSNTNVKIVGKNSTWNLKPLSKEIWRHLDHLLYMKNHQFTMQIGDLPLKTITPKYLFHSKSPLMLNRWEVLSLHTKMARDSWYYKPIIPFEPPFEDRIGDLPYDFYDSELQKVSPIPKFTF